ncbi:DNA polymerase nu [Elysia marginata]|uniref:DNA polymerase nu n=1 Tax=Elysia marginata TaxID=1093978 RepID=A0AAV4HJM1_9GAST|nr:DNA polymerase nu [Elysia marginata]
MKRAVIRPVYPPPKLDRYSYLTTEAQVTLAALEIKYDYLIKSVQKKEESDPVDYYKSIYDASFKKENDMIMFSQREERGMASKSVRQGEYKMPASIKRYSAQRKSAGFCSEIFMTEKPSDEEIAQSIVSLTQKTSAPESPLIDFDSDSTDEYDRGEKNKCKRIKLGHYFSQLDTGANGIQSLQIKQNESTDLHLCDEDMVDAGEEKSACDQQKVLKLNSTNTNLEVTSTLTMLTSENPLFTTQSITKENLASSSPNMWNACKPESNLNENPCPSPLLLTSSKENSQKSPEAATFDLNVSDCEIEQLNDSLDRVEESKDKLLPCQSAGGKNTPNANEESPLCIKSEISSQLPEKLNINYIKEKSSNWRQTQLHTNAQNGISIKALKIMQNNSPPSLKSKAVHNKPKRKQAAFKPPQKAKVDSSCLNDKPSGDMVNFGNLTCQERTETVDTLISSSALVLTLIYDNGNALCSKFPAASEHGKVKELIVLANQRCYLIPSAFVKKEDIGTKILQIISATETTKIICNCKEFLIGLWQLLEQKDEDDSPLQCTNLQDPCIASWLLDPEQSPSSFKQMCQVAGIHLENDDDTWLNCFKATPLLMKNLKTKLSSLNQWALYTEIEMRLVPILACMETRPININVSVFLNFSDILKSKLTKLEEKIYKEVGHEFSINSHMQLRQVLYSELKLDQMLPTKVKIGKTSVAQLKSTSEASLNQFIDVHPLPSLILEYRQLQKLKSTYVDGMMSAVHDGRLTTHWDQTAAATGRLTSSRPNIQAVPKTAMTITDYEDNYIIGAKTFREAKINVREPFISRKGFSLLSADFQQIELRILAHLSEDSNLLSTFWQTNSNDVFVALTSKWQGKDITSVTFSDREQTKRVVYSVMYGVGKDKLSQYLKVKPDAAKSIMSSFLAQFPAIDKFTKKCCDFAKEYGYTETICARRRYFPHINSPSPVLRAQAQRQAVNFCVQGSAADVCKLAMLSVEEALKKHNEIDCRLLFQIHDELIWEVKENQLQQAKALVQGVMENMKSLCGKFCNLQVPLAVSLSSGQSWANLSPLDTPSHSSLEKIGVNTEGSQ